MDNRIISQVRASAINAQIPHLFSHSHRSLNPRAFVSERGVR